MPDVKVNITGDNKDALNKLDQVEKKGQGLGTSLGNALRTGLGTVGRITGAALAAAGAGLDAIGAAAYNAYGDFQQLSGGVQKLFGTGLYQDLESYAESIGQTTAEASEEFIRLQQAQTDVMNNAAQAFQTTGMSANEYMENVTGFSAALINSLGGDTVAAAQQADVAMRAISDNVNTFGTDMESVTQAYQGFAKQNWTMLDNLKLGYGGTRSEMERLIEDANAFAAANGMAADLSIESFADIVTAIDLIQKKQGIAETTAYEAATTVQGATRMMQASWENLLTGLANPDADMGKLIEDFTSSLGTLVSVAGPVITQIMESISTSLPAVVPQLIETAMMMLQTLVQGLIDNVPLLVEGFNQVITMLTEAMPTMLPMMLEGAVTLFLGILTGLTEAMPQILEGLSVALIALIEMLPTLIPALLEAAVAFFGAIVTAIITKGPEILSALGDALNELLQKVADKGTEMLTAFGDLMGKAREGISNKASEIWNSLKQAVQDAIDRVTSLDFAQIGSDIINGIKDGLLNAAGNLASAARDAVSSALGAAKDFLGIASPSKVFRDQVGKMMVQGTIVGIEDDKHLLDDVVDKTFNFDLQPSVNAAGVFSDAMARTMALAKPVQNVTNNVYEREDSYVAATIFTRALMQGV